MKYIFFITFFLFCNLFGQSFNKFSFWGDDFKLENYKSIQFLSLPNLNQVGDTLYDYSGNSNNGILQDTISKSGNFFFYDGTGDYIVLSNDLYARTFIFYINPASSSEYIMRTDSDSYIYIENDTLKSALKGHLTLADGNYLLDHEDNVIRTKIIPKFYVNKNEARELVSGFNLVAITVKVPLPFITGWLGRYSTNYYNGYMGTVLFSDIEYTYGKIISVYSATNFIRR